MNPITRKEVFLSAAAGESVDLPEPITREEIYLAKAAGADVEMPEPITRQEVFLKAVADNSVKPTGNINITDTQVTDVTNYATAQVVDANLIADNIKDGVEILGITGTYSGGGSTPPETPTDALLFYSPNEMALGVNNARKNWSGTLYYSTDHTNWTEWSGTTLIISALSDGYHKIYLRGVGNFVLNDSAAQGRLYCSGTAIKCVGNCNNLLDYTKTIDSLYDYNSAFVYIFAYMGNVEFDVELPATTLNAGCYSNMFLNCVSMTKAPSLPATTLTSNCYLNMFNGCSSLTTAPALPATTLSSNCYSSMFGGCKSLKYLPELPATTLAYKCYYNMFSNCTLIKLSTEQTGEYQTPYHIPTSGTGTDYSGAMQDMFANTGGTFTGTPTINTTYYTSNTVIPET